MSKRAFGRVGLIGGGAIGAGWAARLVLNGVDVALYEPSVTVQKRVKLVLQNAERAMRKMTLAPIELRGNLTFVKSVEGAARDVDFVQESVPERLEVKREVLQEVCEHAGEGVVVASSTSGLLPSELQAGLRFPQRVLVGHPFHPVYLLPLVEVVGGRETGEEAKKRAGEFYRGIGMHPLVVRKEIDAFVADRMMEALWREALHLVNDGVATVEEVDTAICYGAGLRWAFMGPFLVYRIAGGEGGFRHFMEQFAPSLKWPWARFEGPEMTGALLDKLAAQSDEEAGGRSIAELERLRDDCLVGVLQALRGQDMAAGRVLRGYEEVLYEVAGGEVGGDLDGLDDLDVSRVLCLHRGRVGEDWVDYNNHMSESRYLQAFGDASDALFRRLGVNREYHQRGFSYFTAETHLNFVREMRGGEGFLVTTQLLGGDAKRIHLFHAMYRDDGEGGAEPREGNLVATTEQMILHVNVQKGKVCAAEEGVWGRLQRILEGHRGLAVPEQAGRAIGKGK